MKVSNETLYTDGSVSNETLYTNASIKNETLKAESAIFSTSMYGQRMFDYYPPIISCIQEFQAIIDAEYPEIEKLHSEIQNAVNDAYLTTMGEARIIQWEKIFGIVPVEGSTLDDRRETITARVRGQGKMNTTLINSIVKIFTGGTANSWVSDGVLYIEITPPPDNKQYVFANVEQELKNKVPAHLGVQIKRNYYTWNEVQKSHSTWQDVKDNFATWSEVLIFTPFSEARR